MKSKACRKSLVICSFYSFTSFRQEQGSSLHNRDHEANHQISVLSFDSGIKSYYSSTETVSGKMSLTKVKNSCLSLIVSSVSGYYSTYGWLR